jgi:hypothetical protein
MKWPSGPSECSPTPDRKTITPVGSGALTKRWSRVGVQKATPQKIATDLLALTPSQQEAQLREAIQTYCKHVDVMFFDQTWGEANKRVVKTFGKSRANMTLPMLQKVMVWLEEMYPVKMSKR